ncbi:FecR domain-containing protein [Sphingobacterium haloxyli]|uniref:Anti-sigma factor n=1 Tax=Sphingobacterium haloxyli TaxID=2100533 RepID=A0A2S9J5J9_9SPHI|nr:FecR domain-containing protein [Sphingobacterium haloxyli]PRD48073.1 anti-sigma factor [Sphingobacterium haloxyli]
MKKDIQTLLNKYKEGKCSEQELRLLEAWFFKIADESQGEEPDSEQIRKIFNRIAHKASPSKPKVFKIGKRYATIAASILVVIGIGFSLLKTGHIPSLPWSETANYDIAAATDKAILTLQNGKKIALDSLSGHTVFSKYGVEILPGKNGEIIYRQLPIAHHHPSIDVSAYHTIETPRGGKYQVQLADGSKVWLNAGSSLTFPVRFDATERKVRLSGEAFFVVNKLIHGPDTERMQNVSFLVETDGQTVEVLGTEFNIKNYTDDLHQYTTLVEGSVKVKLSSGKEIILRPGEQAQSGEHLEAVHADLEREIAWKNGDFVFKRETLEEICKQISRWYNIDITYPEDIKSVRFSGMIRRSQPLSVIINMIESAGKVKATLKERRLTITKT